MNKILRRLLTFFIGIPLVVLIVYFNPYDHFVLHCAITIFSCIASAEIYNLLNKNIPMQKKWVVVGLATLIPISTYACILFNLDFVISTLVFLASFMILLIMEIFYPNPQNPDIPFADSNKKVVGSFRTFIWWIPIVLSL